MTAIHSRRAQMRTAQVSIQRRITTTSNHCSMRNDGIFGDDNNAVADVVKLVVRFVRLAGGLNGYVVADTRVLVDDGVLDLAVRANANAGFAFALVHKHGFLGFVKIAAEDDHAVQLRAAANDGAQADDAARDARMVDDTTIRNHRMINLGSVDLRAGQVARTAENR